MIKKFRLPSCRVIVWLLTAALGNAGCNGPGGGRKTVVAEPLHQPLFRFEQDLFACGDSVSPGDVAALRKKYGLFFDMYCARIVRIADTNDAVTAFHVDRFVRDPDLRRLKEMSDSLYLDFDDVHRQLNQAFGYYRHYFPGHAVPRFYTCLSAFNYQVITADSMLAVCLDMYLGAGRGDMYGSVGFPNYMSERFAGPYIAVDAMKGWFQSIYEIDSVKNELLSQMIYYGKMLHFLDYMLPGMDDTLKTGYAHSQLDWCRRNESDLWAHLIEQNLLFNTNPQAYFKYINDGPTTSGLPRESPARLGYWIGWQIVRSWAEHHPDATLGQLLDEPDARRLLNESGYKPAR